MYMDDYQIAARTTAIGNSLDHFVMGLTEEAGEVAGVMKRYHRGDEKYGERIDDHFKYLSDYAAEKLIDELGDVLWYITMIAEQLDSCLSEVAERNLMKLKDRKDRDVIKGSGDNR
jgi:NTP pyrophosphatase (non-canonical NTP hydrolase)